MTSGGTAVSQSKSNIIVWYDGGESAFRSKDYHASRILLGKAYSELELTYPDLEDRILQFNDWQNLLDLLVICQCKLQKYDEAQNTLDSLIQKIQSESIPETLVDAIIKAADVVISSYYKVERLDNAVNLATQIIDIKKNNNNRFALDTQLILAEIYLRQNKIEEAKSRCLEIVAARDSNERAEIDNAADLVLFLIYSKTDNMSEAICKKELLSETYKSKRY
jgi:tetratricopeptide (TPR) repeat protein